MTAITVSLGRPEFLRGVLWLDASTCAATGTLLALAADGRIREDYQFIEPAAASAAPARETAG